MEAMNNFNSQYGRREFLKKATQAAASVAVSAGLASATEAGEKGDKPADAIPSRVLGKTGLKLPILGYGGAALPTALAQSTFTRGAGRVGAIRL